MMTEWRIQGPASLQVPSQDILSERVLCSHLFILLQHLIKSTYGDAQSF